MILTSLKLENFRNFVKGNFEFHPALTIIVGPNAVGKTNLLESIHFILTGSGIKEENMAELVSFANNQAQLQALLTSQSLQTKLSALINTSPINSRKISINAATKTVHQLIATCPAVVLFTPRLLAIIDTDPSARRQYFDRVISRVDPSYAKALNNYHNALIKRNKLLSKLFSQQDKLKEELTFWDSFLIKNASLLQDMRQQYADKLNHDQKVKNFVFQIAYIQNSINEATLNASFEKSLLLQRTLVGPQKDDFRISLIKNNQSVDIHTYGSRSQQRLALFWLKLHELTFFEESFEMKPILLLDDIISELDEENQLIALNTIRNFQTILTTTESALATMIEEEFSLIELDSPEDGKIG